MYRLTKGVVLAKVGGERLLIATSPAWNVCPYIKVLSPIYGMFWQGLELGMGEDAIIQEINEKIGIKRSTLIEQFSGFINELCKEGYITKEEDA